MLRTTVKARRLIGSAASVCVLTCALTFALAAPAGATGAYPGETLSVALSGPAVVGHATTFVASGHQTDVNSYAGGFGLEVYVKDPNVDPTCAASYPAEQSSSINDPSETQVVIGLWQGPGTSFSVPFKVFFSKPGRVLLCAYSTWVTDTAASATLSITVSSNAPQKPVNTKRPHVTRSGNTLNCNRGTWHDAKSFSYGWLVSGQTKKGASKQSLAVTKSLKGHTVACKVTASNSAGHTAASSASFHVH